MAEQELYLEDYLKSNGFNFEVIPTRVSLQQLNVGLKLFTDRYPSLLSPDKISSKDVIKTSNEIGVRRGKLQPFLVKEVALVSQFHSIANIAWDYNLNLDNRIAMNLVIDDVSGSSDVLEQVLELNELDNGETFSNEELNEGILNCLAERWRVKRRPKLETELGRPVDENKEARKQQKIGLITRLFGAALQEALDGRRSFELSENRRIIDV